MTRVYIAGPMRGHPAHNIPAFRRAAELFRANGFEVVSPVEVGEKLGGQDSGLRAEDFVRADLVEVLTCDAIALLPGWEKSTGARCEATVAVTLGFTFYDAVTMARIPAPVRIAICGGYERTPGAVDTLDGLRDEVTEWANKTFLGAKPSSKAEHLRREAVELCSDPTDVAEMADIFILLSHISDGLDLVGAIRAKLERNKARTWGKPDARGVVEHVAEGVA